MRQDYLDNRINTIFLNGKPVDDVDSATVTGGSTLALSASMPGLVGAAMRKGGPISGFRGTITHVEGDLAIKPGIGAIILKLYNMVVEELGPNFLEKGIILRDVDVRSYFENRPEDFWSGCRSAIIDGTNVDPALLKDWDWSNLEEVVRVCITARE